MVDRLQIGMDPEILLQEYLAGKDHVAEKKKLSQVKPQPKKSCRD